MKKITQKSLESDVKANLRELCKAHGAKAIHIASGNVFSEPGAPDYVILTQYGGTIYCECKSPTGKLSRKQELFGDEIESRGGIYFVYNGLNDDDLVNYLKHCRGEPFLAF